MEGPLAVTVPDRTAPGAECGRRKFLERLWTTLGVVAVGEGVAVAAASVAPSAGGGDPGPATVVAGPVDELARGSVRAFPRERFHLVRLPDGGFLALSSRCTHLGCAVSWDEGGRFLCPCHGSSFDLRGDVVGPPALRALDLFAVTIEGGVVKVDSSRRVQRSAFDSAHVTYP